MVLGALFVLLLLLGGTAYAAGERVSRSAVAGGGKIDGGQATLRSAFGQPAAGVVANAGGTLCTGFACGAGVMADAPISGLTASNSSPTTLGAATSFSAGVTTGDNVLYAWEFGDGSGATGSTPTHAYGAAGTYTATVTASNGAGSATATTTVSVTGSSSDFTVNVVNFSFEPDPMTIRVGDTVTWVLQEGFHNVVADDGSFTSGLPSSSWTTYSFTFTEVGVYPYFCEVHGGPGGAGMAGTVIVEADEPSEPARKIWLPVIRTAP